MQRPARCLEFSTFCGATAEPPRGQNDFPIWLVRAERLPLSVIDDERIGKENTGYVRHHKRRLLSQERPQNKLRELLLRQVHERVRDDRVHEFDGKAVPDRRISRMSTMPGLQPRAIPLQRVRRRRRYQGSKGRTDRH